VALKIPSLVVGPDPSLPEGNTVPLSYLPVPDIAHVSLEGDLHLHAPERGQKDLSDLV